MDCESGLPDWPCVVIHGLGDAARALCLARPVCLLSAPSAARTGGVFWWRALIEAARAGAPNVPMIDVLDCGTAPGLAMAALRAGQRHLVLERSLVAWHRVAAAAGEIGAVALPSRPSALDLGARGAERHLAAHLVAPS